jgi:ABC-2 type transport system permease protein
MFPILRYETDRRLRGTLVMAGLIAVFGLFMIAFFPSVKESGAAIEEYANNLPPALREMFGVEGITTIGGFLATELYQFVWVLLLGVYFAYRAASLIAADVETGRLDLLLATPVSRTRILFERFAALVPGILAINLVAIPVLFAGTVWVGEPVSLAKLLQIHLLSVPYLLACASIGLVLSVSTDSESLANRVAIGLVFGLFVLEAVVAAAGYDAVGYLSPTRYFDPTAIMVAGDVDWLGGLALLAATAGLVALARTIFVRADVT